MSTGDGDQDNEVNECKICWNETELITLECGCKAFCKQCIEDWSKVGDKCPICFKNLPHVSECIYICSNIVILLSIFVIYIMMWFFIHTVAYETAFYFTDVCYPILLDILDFGSNNIVKLTLKCSFDFILKK